MSIPSFIFLGYLLTLPDYRYKDNHGNNDHDPHGPEEQDYGDDPYGFILLDGAEDALQGSFPRNYIFVHEDDPTGKPLKTRDNFMSDDPLIMGTAFDHEESWHYVYCHKGKERECDNVFIDGAQDTITALPRHIGSGPYARIASMEPVHESHLPDYHIGRRALRKERSMVYKLVFDYAFDLIKRQTPVNIRVDYTNVIGYWDAFTGPKSGKGASASRRHEKRWNIPYPVWLKKLNGKHKALAVLSFVKLTPHSEIELLDDGVLPMRIKKEMLLYRTSHHYHGLKRCSNHL